MSATPMKIAIVTDAWYPQVNGVVRTLAATVAELDRRGHEVELITPQRFATLPLPSYRSIRVAVAPRFSARRMLHAFDPDIVHIATEGPIGWSARNWCLARQRPLTTSFHTRFPDYLAVRTGISAERFWPVLRRFHAPSRAVLVATESLAGELEGRDIGPTRLWSRGVDRALFCPHGPVHPLLACLPRPILLSVGRVAAEKNLEAFLDAPVQGSKVVIGDGPDLERLRLRYPGAFFFGAMAGEDLVSAYRAADCFVFPSRTDTFGLVLIEALACGLPLAALPVAGPVDIVGRNGRGTGGDFPGTVAALDDDLARAIRKALTLDRSAAAAFAERFTWTAATNAFVATLQAVAGDDVRHPALAWT